MGDGVRLMSSADARSVGFSWQEGTREFYTSRETMPARGVKSPVAASKKEALVRFTPRSQPGTVRLQRVDVGGGTHAGCGTVQARLRYLRKTSIELAPEPDAKGGTGDC